MPKPVITFVFKVLRNWLPWYILDTCPNLWSRSCSSQCFGMVCLGKYLTHAQTCHHVRVQSATESTASVHAWHMWSRLLRNYGLPRYIILNTCPNLWSPSCSKCYGIDCLGTYLTHAQTCDHVSSKCYGMDFLGTYMYILDTCPNLWARSCSKCYGIDCLGTCLTHVITLVLRNYGLPRYIILDTCPYLWSPSCSKCYGIDCLGTYLTHAQTCEHVCVQSAMEWSASVHTWHVPKPAIALVFRVLW